MHLADPILRITVAVDAEGLEALGDGWNKLVARAGASVFQTLEWQSTWWRSFAACGKLHTVMVWAGEDLVGIVPLFRDRVQIVGIPLLRRLLFVGGVDSDYSDVIVAPGYEEHVAQAVAEHLSAVRDWDLIELERVPDRSKAIGFLMTALAERGHAVKRTVDQRCFAIPLPASWEEYLAHLNTRTRKNLLREQHKLLSAGFRFELASSTSSIAEAMEQFLTLHIRQWVSKGERTALQDPQRQRFHRELARRLSQTGLIRLSSLRREDQRVAVEYGFLFDGKYYKYNSGLALDSTWSRFSPGMVLTLMSIEQAIRLGLREFDLTRGAERYKTVLGAHESTASRYQIVASPSRRLRVDLYIVLTKGRRLYFGALRRARRLLFSTIRHSALKSQAPRW